MSNYRSNGFFERSGAALVIVGTLLSVGTLLGQPRTDYKVAERDRTKDLVPGEKARETAEKKQSVRALRNQAIEALRSDAGFSDEKAKEFDKWFNEYEFPILTLYDAEELKLLPETKVDFYEGRKRLFRDMLERAENEKARERLVELAYDFFTKVAADDYHPAVRYNAMLIVGELNQRELNRKGSESVPPQPLPKALRFMLAEFQKPDQIDAVRLAALLGIQRHVQLDAQAISPAEADQIPDADLKSIRKLALDLVNQREAPAARTQAGHDWMRRRAVEALSWLAAITLDQEIVDLVIARVSDSEEDRGVRCEAALAFDTMKYVPEPGKRRLGTTAIKIKPSEVAGHLVQFVTDSVTADVERVDRYLISLEEADEIYGPGTSGGMGERPSRKKGGKMGSPGGPGAGGGRPPGMRMGMGMGMGAMGGNQAALDPYGFRIEPVYRKLRHEIACAMKGIRGTEEWRKGDGPGGLYRVWPQDPSRTADAAKPDPKMAAEKELLDAAGQALKRLSEKLKVKADELQTEDFTLEKLPLKALNDVTKQAAVARAKAKPAKPGAADVKDPFQEPAESEPESEPAATVPAEPKPAKGKAKAKAAEPKAVEPADLDAEPAE